MARLRVIISGTSGAGKTTIVRALRGIGPFRQVQAVTTRPPRGDDHGEYVHLTDEQFAQLRADKSLVTDVEYRDMKYGVTQQAIEHIERDGKIPVLTITAESAVKLIKSSQDVTPCQYLSLFIDSSDPQLDQRLGKRDGKVDSEAELIRRRTDRSYRDEFTCVIDNQDLKATTEFIRVLAESFQQSGILSARIVKLGMRCSVYLEDGDENEVRGASYDLRLGDEYFYGGKIKHLSKRDPILLIEPYDYAIVTSREITNLPLNVCGRFDLAVSLFAQGVILSNGPQIDPGFRGPLFCLLFNTSSSPVLLKRGGHYATLELHQLIEPTHGYTGKYQRKTLLDYLPTNAARGAINELKREVEDLKRSSKTLQTVILGVISIFLAVIAVLVSLR